MSELKNIEILHNTCRRHLLTTVSAAALASCIVGAVHASEGDADHPTVWIELGGQLERNDGGEAHFAPPFLLSMPRPSIQTISPLSVERPARYSNGAEGKIIVAPKGTDWTFSAAVRYGRSNAARTVHQQTYPQTIHFQLFGTGSAAAAPLAAKFSDTQVEYHESHTILDFQAGKDVGLGFLGYHGSSTLSLGVRYAQFSSKSNISLKSDPDWHVIYKYIFSLHKSVPLGGQPYHSNMASASAARSFRGLGPSISWDASMAVAGRPETAEIDVDWGVNAAVLFGRQKAIVHHHTTSLYHGAKYSNLERVPVYPPISATHERSRSKIVPNVGGFAGLSFRYAQAKVSLGYRADFFFDAVDGGIDERKDYNRSFYGPFATIAIGLRRVMKSCDIRLSRICVRWTKIS